MKMSAEVWHEAICSVNNKGSKIPASLHKEIPNMLSVNMERSCNMSCLHCIYQKEVSSKNISSQHCLQTVAGNMAKQLNGDNPLFLHEGRRFAEWHLNIYKAVRIANSKIKLGLLDNGSYTNYIEAFKREGVYLDWLDVSVDGPESIHNLQRNSTKAFETAITGLKRGAEIAKQTNVLMTLTQINYKHVLETASMVFQNGANQLHITPVSPTKKFSQAVDIEEMRIALSQICRATKKFGKEKIFFRIYRHEDLIKLAEVVGHKAFTKAFKSAFVRGSELLLKLRGLTISYFPISLWPTETILIDADAAYRVAFSAEHTLSELRNGLEELTVSQLTENSNLQNEYHHCVSHWWNNFGNNFFLKEKEVIRKWL